MDKHWYVVLPDGTYASIDGVEIIAVKATAEIECYEDLMDHGQVIVTDISVLLKDIYNA
jgi:hypothetical protein